MSQRTWVIVGALAALAILAAFYFRPRSDAELSAAMVGQWVATDPGNASLHKHEEGVEREEIDIRSDGTLTYHIKLKPESVSRPATSSGPSDLRVALSPKFEDKSLWGWQVVKGRLLIKDMGPDSTQEWMKPLKFSVARNSFALHRRSFASKEFERLKE